MNAETPAVAPATSRPGNVTVRELAATLSKSAPPQSPSPEDAPVETPPAAEVVPAATPPGETIPPADSPTAPPSETPEAPPAELPPETPPEEPPAEPAGKFSPELDAELKPLVDELKKAGAKGALEILQKRIPKLVDQRDTERNARLAADEKNRALEAELAEARQAPPTAATPDTSGQHPEVAAVVKRIANVDHWIAQCEQNPDGLKVPDGRGGEIELDRNGVTEALRGLDRQRQELVAEKVNVSARVKEQFRADYATAHAQAQKSYPEIFKKDSPEAKLGEALLKAVPELKERYADFEVVIGRYIAGCKLELGRAKLAGAPQKPAAVREPALVPSDAPGARPAPVNGANKEVQEAEATFRKSGRTSDLARWNAAKARAQRAKT